MCVPEIQQKEESVEIPYKAQSVSKTLTHLLPIVIKTPVVSLPSRERRAFLSLEKQKTIKIVLHIHDSVGRVRRVHDSCVLVVVLFLLPRGGLPPGDFKVVLGHSIIVAFV